MIVLGISYGYHDSSASLVTSNGLIYSAAEERFSRQKHDSNFPTNAIEACLEHANCSIKDIDFVFFHEDPQMKFSRVMTSSFVSYPFSRTEFLASSMSWFGKKLWTFNDISKRLNLPHQKIRYLNHHHSHATQAFVNSGFESSNILIVDAVGEWCSSSLYTGEIKNNTLQIRTIKNINFPHSLGLVYSAITSYLGFSPNSDECSTMALAAFGTPSLTDELRKVIKVTDDGYTIDQTYFNFLSFSRPAVTQKFINAFGPPCENKNIYQSNSIKKISGESSTEKRLLSIAASMQQVFEEAVLSLCKTFPQQSGNLCIAGGSALNCVANQKIVEKTSFKNIYIPPDPGDGGTSLGIASLGLSQFSKRRPLEVQTPYTGSNFEKQDLLKSLPIKLNELNRIRGKKFYVTPLDSTNTRAHTIVRHLMNDNAVGVFHGKSECGPRALGNRSILFRPDKIDLAETMSTKIKRRAYFRPYALAMTPEGAKEILVAPEAQHRLYKWMQFAAPVNPKYHTKLTAGVHIDGTTRPQICKEQDNPLLHSIIKKFELASGLPALINTSFNEAGSPIVNTPLDALIMFLRTELKCLLIENLFFSTEEVHNAV